VAQHGLDQRPIFRDADDYRRMLGDLAELCRAQALALHAYVLMPGHFHLLLTPADATGLSRAMQALGRRYVRWYNARYARRGTLWEGRFHSTIVEPAAFLLDCMRYIELQPAAAGLVDDAASYPWSSLAQHLGRQAEGRADPPLTDHPQYWALGNTPFERQAAYARLCAQAPDPTVLERIRRDTQRGWPLGGPEFLAALSRGTGRILVRRKVGRPRRADAGLAP